MTVYFDEKETLVKEGADIVAVEKIVKKDIRLVAGDKDTPNNIREMLLAIIAIHQYEFIVGDKDLAMRKPKQSYVTYGQSDLITALHRAFHGITMLQIKTCYGIMGDDPEQHLAKRDIWVKEHLEED